MFRPTRRVRSGLKTAQNASFSARMCLLWVNNVPVDFGSQIPKNLNFGPMNRTFNFSNVNNNADHDEIFIVHHQGIARSI